MIPGGPRTPVNVQRLGQPSQAMPLAGYHVLKGDFNPNVDRFFTDTVDITVGAPYTIGDIWYSGATVEARQIRNLAAGTGQYVMVTPNDVVTYSSTSGARISQEVHTMWTTAVADSALDRTYEPYGSQVISTGINPSNSTGNITTCRPVSYTHLTLPTTPYV